MERFLPWNDDLANMIQEKSVVLYQKMLHLPVDDLGLPYHCLVYFKKSHGNRLFFSISTSACLLYRSIRATGRQVQELTIMDYGAGVGTLYLLAGMIGFRKVIYNDFLEDWRKSALLIAEKMGLVIDEYIVGDITDTFESLSKSGIQCDIITSRNVIEHIYKLDLFYSTIRRYQPAAVVYSSTTANFYNPATHIQHMLLHKRFEKVYFPRRKELIRKQIPGITDNLATHLAGKTRGLATEDLVNALNQFRQNGKIERVEGLHSNTCDPLNGVWAEHLLTFSQYKALIGTPFESSFEPGFWDTHYSNPIKNIFARMMNLIINLNRVIGIVVAPFIYVIAKPRK